MSGPAPGNPIPEQKAGQQQNRNTLLVIGPCLAVEAGRGPVFFWECSFACPAAEARGIQSYRDGPIGYRDGPHRGESRIEVESDPIQSVYVSSGLRLCFFWLGSRIVFGFRLHNSVWR
jgi:hypothetical protein